MNKKNRWQRLVYKLRWEIASFLDARTAWCWCGLVHWIDKDVKIFYWMGLIDWIWHGNFAFFDLNGEFDSSSCVQDSLYGDTGCFCLCGKYKNGKLLRDEDGDAD